MNQFVIIEKLKEAIGDNKVFAAIFYTYSFNPRFFENCILTTFLPHVNFSDNEIQNTILWRRYAKELPHITVYCDFHAKHSEAPNLQYDVRTIDLPAVEGLKACFHPKVSLILLDDWSLIILTGSNNLTEGGWCTKKEIVSIKKLKKGEVFPYSQKHQLWDFMKKTQALRGEEYTDAENQLDDFFRQRLHTEDSDFQFFDSFKTSFHDFLKKILANKDEEKFERIEIISPYLSTGVGLIENLKSLVYENNLFINVPYKAMNEADITENNYNAFQKAGVKWSRFIQPETEKGFRFNHSKVYRLKSKQKVFTIMGSVNFTDAAWRGRKKNGNLETAIVYEAPSAAWEPWLEEYNNVEIVFSKEQSDETNRDERMDAPDFVFRLNWLEKTLKYNNLVRFRFSGLIMLSNRNIELRTGPNTIELDESMIDELANNPIIRVKQYHLKRELFYYPIQEGLESKPLPLKLRLKDSELIEIWEHISIKEEAKSEITELIEKYIYSRLDKEGDLSNNVEKVKSTINMMASHISALIRLEKRIFELPRLKGEFKKAKELIDYYLFTENIDTLSGYRKLLQDMYDDKVILPGVYWFLLNMLIKEFYTISKIRNFYREINEPLTGIKEKIDFSIESINIYSSQLRGQLKHSGVNMDLLKWINANI